MKTKFLTLALLLMGVSAGAQTPVPVSVSDDCSQNGKKTELRPSGTENGYTWVNLGLSVKWATMNVGATKPEDYGYYFAWGETSEKSEYFWSTYTDNPATLPLDHDAAAANWKGAWRMPTDAEWTELREQCTWTLTTQNNVKGYLVTSKKNGNSIFLPVAGYRIDTHLNSVGSYGYYWSSSLDEDDSSMAYVVSFRSSSVLRSRGIRLYGYSVRPVCP